MIHKPRTAMISVEASGQGENASEDEDEKH